MIDPCPILLVEDNPNDEALTLRALQKAGLAVDVTVIRDGAAALEHLHGNGTSENGRPPRLPRVVLLDLKLPKVDGLQVLARIREHETTKHLPVVVFTSSDEERDRLESYRLGANSYVRKPVSYPEYAATVSALGTYWSQINLPIR